MKISLDSGDITHAIITRTKEIRHALDNNHYICRVFLEFRKAFDTVNNDILMSNFLYYGMNRHILQTHQIELNQQKTIYIYK